LQKGGGELEVTNCRADTAFVLRLALVRTLACGYWIAASVALGVAYLIRAGSEDPPFDQEHRLLMLAFVGWASGSLVALGLVKHWPRVWLLLLWTLQGAAFTFAWISTISPDDHPWLTAVAPFSDSLAGGIEFPRSVALVVGAGLGLGLVAIGLARARKPPNRAGTESRTFRDGWSGLP
jgi:hypothetical protein